MPNDREIERLLNELRRIRSSMSMLEEEELSVAEELEALGIKEDDPRVISLG